MALSRSGTGMDGQRQWFGLIVRMTRDRLMRSTRLLDTSSGLR